MKLPKRYTITSALPYANGLKHVGHLAGAYIPADIYVRYLRAQKRNVVYVCGSDEHGAAITIQAMKEGTTPKEIVDKYHEIMKQNFHDLGISFDIYHRTSAPIHHETAQEFFTALNDRGDLEKKETEQFYDEEAQSFLADRYIVGTCPVCGNNNAFGDQCEVCGSSLSPELLINPRSTLSGNAPVKKTTIHWYLPLNKHEAFLREWILEEHKNDWKTNVLGQCKSWLDAGLQPRSVTRDLDWGVQVPLPDAEGKVLYVWFDAPIGYISATKQWALDNGKDWKPYWNDKDTKLVHFVGKDNIVFHCIIFPVMLKLHGNILPANVPANEFMNLEGDKMSTSRGWSIEMEEYINDWVKKENGESMADVLRYYLTAISPETKDSEFTWKGFQEANNSELANIFGNFVNRTFVLMHKLCKGKVPPLHAVITDDADRNMFAEIENAKSKIENLLETYKFREALFEVIDLARKGNRYMQDKQPWIVAKQLEAARLKLQVASEEEQKETASLKLQATSDQEQKEAASRKLQATSDQEPNEAASEEKNKESLKLEDSSLKFQVNSLQQKIDNCIHICLQLTANLAILINPFLPFTAKKLCYMMKVVDKMLDWENAGKAKLLSVGYSLREPQILFRKIEDAEINAQLEKLKVKSKKVEESKKEDAGSGLPVTGYQLPVTGKGEQESNIGQPETRNLQLATNTKPEIAFDDFAKIDLKVGTIVSAEKVQKADKLLKLQIDLRFETRTIVSGIALHFQPEEIVGRQVTVVVNLAPRKMRGIESNGMILMAEDAAGKLYFINPEQKIDAGSSVS